MENGKCKFGFPFEYQDHTTEQEEGGYPLYVRKKPDGRKGLYSKFIQIKGKKKLFEFTNQWVR
jgi:hypothetical protein